MRRLRTAVYLLAAITVAAPAAAWDATGHRIVAQLALEGWRDAPDWLRDKDIQAQVADQATTPDRWRSVKIPQLTHLNNPDHYVDIEQLDDYGLTLRTMPRLRHEYVKVLTLARAQPGFRGKPVRPETDPERTAEYPGFLPHAALETYGKLVSAFRTERAIEKIADPARANELAMAKASAMYNMGVLAHYIGDAAQPLHTTIHHHGWVGTNPEGYTTDRAVHAYIDGGVIRLHHITLDMVRASCSFDRTVDARDPWDDVLEHLERSFKEVEPLYKLKKSGDLEKEPGKRFILARLADGATMLSAMYRAAWDAATPTDADVKDFVKYDDAANPR